MPPYSKNMFQRKNLVDALHAGRGNGRVKIITGLRRSGKSFLLKNLYIPNLLAKGVRKENIVFLELDDIENFSLRNPFRLLERVLSSVSKKGMNYVFIDEIQLCQEVPNPDAPGDMISFIDTCNSLLKHPEIDLYITGSNSRMLSSDIVTRFRDRGDEIHVSPLTIGEILEERQDSPESAFNDYLLYGGLPLVASESNPAKKAKYLTSVMSETYLKDIVSRNNLSSDKGLKNLGRILSTTTGSLTNIETIANTLTSIYREKFYWSKVNDFIKAFKDSFLIEEVERYDVVGRRNIEAPHKFYFTDNGLMNAFSDFSHFEKQQALECAVYNHLRASGYSVEIGVVPIRKMENGIRSMRTYEVDFIATKYLTKYYIQVACSLDGSEKERQEKASLSAIHDSNTKILLIGENIPPMRDGAGILTESVLTFLENGCRI